MEILDSFFQWEKQEKVRRYTVLNRFARKKQTVLAGSSLMEQFPIHEFWQAEHSQHCIYNRGIGGIATTELLDLLEVCIFALDPARVFINIGSNDLNGEEDPIDGLIERYRLILEQIQVRLPQALVYVLAYYPVNERDDFGLPEAREGFKWRTNARIARANARVEQMAARLGMTYLNLNAGLLDETGQLKKEYAVDGMHMYANGYRAVYEVLRPYLLG
jgi:lysophospholipase L1-like esterase